MSNDPPAAVSITEARAELAELITRVRMRYQMTAITQRGRIHAAVIDPDFYDAILRVGGRDEALRLLGECKAADVH
jgi:prevent-host-death family protein